jgi:hypothetical protein
VSTRARTIIIALIALTIVAAVGVAVSLRSIEPRLQEWLKASLSESLEGDVELGAVRLTWMPLRLHAANLTVRHHGRTDIPPLLVVQTFTMDLQPTDLWNTTIDRAWVDGLEINIPPKDPNTGKRPLPLRGDGTESEDEEKDGKGLFIRRLTATNTRLAVIPSESGKNARVWDIFELDVRNIGNGEAAAFTAALINPMPYGKIDASGHFGPWQSAAPGSSALTGQYAFAADLGTIEGLAGQLTAKGDMRGTLEEIATTGETNTPDFKLTELDGASLPLRTTYDAIVDGTKGDVELKSVNISMGKSRLVATGLVEGTKGVKGKRIIVNVKSSATDLSELLQLTSKAARPVAAGILTIDAALDLPQGKQPVLERLSLAGSVRADQLTFTNDAVQDKIDELSRRGRGKPGDDTINDVASKMTTTFTLEKGVAVYRNFTFAVRGATIRLDGTHSLKTKAVALSGAVLLNASMSATQTGFKSWVLKPFDALFRKGGAGSRLAITVHGTQDEPKLEFDFKRTLKGS